MLTMNDIEHTLDKPKNPGVPFLWCITGKQSPPATWGRKVYIEDEK